MDKLSKDDIRAIIGNPEVADHEVRKIIHDELKLSIPNDLNREQMIDYVYDEYTKALKNIENKKKEVVKEKPSIKSPTTNGEIKPNKKQFIIGLVKQGNLTRKQIIDKVDEDFGYRLRGKTSKVRVSKVLKELHINDMLEINPAGLMKFKGDL